MKANKIFITFFFFLGFLINSNFVFARPIISGISTSQINIDTKFSGAEVLLFGAKGDAGSVIITVRGPKRNYIIDKKDKFLGVWYNKDRLKFKNAYSYYAFFSSDENEFFNRKLLSKLEIGKDHIEFNISGDKRLKNDEEFKIQFIEKLQKQALYSHNVNKVEFLDETLFKVALKFPKNIATGTYTVEIYLVDESDLIAFQAIPIYVNQVGIGSKINQFAYRNSVLYGICAVLMAAIAGFLANFIFVKIFNK